MNNIIQTNAKSQQKIWPRQNNSIDIIENKLKPGEIAVLDCIIYFCSKYQKVFPSQTTIGIHTGLSRETVNRYLGTLCRYGFIESYYRHLHTSLYKISPWFKVSSIRHKLKHILPALKSGLVIALFVATTGINGGGLTQMKINKQVINFKLANSCARVRRYFALPKNLDKLTEEFIKSMRGEKEMIAYQQSEVARSLNCFKLTKAGYIALSAFPDNALLWAQDRLLFARNIQDKFKYFVSLCINYCKDNNIRPDWDTSRHLAQYFNIPERPEYIEKQQERLLIKSYNTKPIRKPAEINRSSRAIINAQSDESIKKNKLNKALKEKSVLEKSCLAICNIWCAKCDLAKIIINSGVMTEAQYFDSLRSRISSLDTQIQELSQ